MAWLPADVHVSEDRSSCTFLSYINGLHPQQHPRLYEAIGASFAELVPLLEAVLDTFNSPPLPLCNADPYGWWKKTEPHGTEPYARYEFVPPVLPPFAPPAPPPERRALPRISLRGRDLQVIVKLASIVLSPSEPSYPGGTWHVEGMRDEAIVATAIYYLANDNVADTRLRFRQSVSEPSYEQDDRAGVERAYGLVDREPLVQHLGHVTTPARRALAWPNSLQHRVDVTTLQLEPRTSRLHFCR